MKQLQSFFECVYQNFNDRKINLVINEMTDDVQWANGMDGGYVYGHEGVSVYWMRQFNLVSSNVTPLEIDAEKDHVKIKVHQVVHDLNNNLLTDEIVYHHFTIRNGKITRFDIGDKYPAE